VTFRIVDKTDDIHGNYGQLQYKNTNSENDYTTHLRIKLKTVADSGTFTDSPVSGNSDLIVDDSVLSTVGNYLTSDSKGIGSVDTGIGVNANGDVETSNSIYVNFIDKKKSYKRARYVFLDRNYYNNNSNDNQLNIYEIEIYDQNGINIAPNGTASQDSTYGSTTPASNLIDGDYDTLAHTKPIDGYNNGTAWMQIDLGEDKYISRVVVYARPVSYRILGSILKLINDKDEIVDSKTFFINPNYIYTFNYSVYENNDQNNLRIVGDASVNKKLLSNNSVTRARYLRLEKSTDVRGGNLNISEIQIFDKLGNNIALNGTASQNTTFNPFVASNLIDDTTSMAHTNGYSGDYTWMQIDLGEDKEISYITIQNRPSFEHRILNSFIKLINDNDETVYIKKIENTQSSYTFYPTQYYSDNDLTVDNKLQSGNTENYLDLDLCKNDSLYVPEIFKLHEYPPASTIGIFHVSETDKSHFYINGEGIQYVFNSSYKRDPLYLDDKRVLGGYFIIEMPEQVEIKSIEIKANDGIRSFYIAGSNDDYNYTELVFAKNEDYNWTPYNKVYINFTKSGSYKFYQFRAVDMVNRGCDVYNFKFHSESYDNEISNYPNDDKVYPPILFQEEDINWTAVYTGTVTETNYGIGDYKIRQSSSWTGGDVTQSHVSRLFMDSTGYWGNPYDYTGYYNSQGYPNPELSQGEHIGIFARDLVVCNVHGGVRLRTAGETEKIPDMIISSGGNVGLGVEEPSFLLELSQDSAYKPTSTVWDTLSDINSKTDVTDANLQICLENITSIPLKTWNLSPELLGENTQPTSLGVTAQDTEIVLPKSVRTTSKTVGGITYTDFKYLDSDQVFWNLYGAVQNLVSRVENLLQKI
jgi:hypothetical protein